MMAVLGVPQVAMSEVSRGADPVTRLKFWLWAEQGVLLELKQRLPDQTRGLLESWGFDAPSREVAAHACVMQTMFRNTGGTVDGGVTIDLRHWNVISAAGTGKMLLREHWRETWSGRGVPPAASQPFNWGLLPTSQAYDPGDYNWGLSSYGLPPGAVFDLEFSWVRDGESFTARIEDIECAPDIHPDPPEPF